MMAYDKAPLVSCLCPTYYRPMMLQNAIALFEKQSYAPDLRELLILDDGGQYPDGMHSEPGRWRIHSQAERIPTITEKFNRLLQMALGDVVVIWEDDDIFMPWHVEAHIKALRDHTYAWSHPTAVWSLYQTAGRPAIEVSDGRFHGSLAVRTEVLKKLGGWPSTSRGDFDQQLMALLRKVSPPANPLAFAAPSYVFRWESTRAYHGQAYMKSPEDSTWYDQVARHIPAAAKVPIAEIAGHLDEETKKVIEVVSRLGPGRQFP